MPLSKTSMTDPGSPSEIGTMPSLRSGPSPSAHCTDAPSVATLSVWRLSCRMRTVPRGGHSTTHLSSGIRRYTTPSARTAAASPSPTVKGMRASTTACDSHGPMRMSSRVPSAASMRNVCARRPAPPASTGQPGSSVRLCAGPLDSNDHCAGSCCHSTGATKVSLPKKLSAPWSAVGVSREPRHATHQPSRG